MRDWRSNRLDLTNPTRVSLVCWPLSGFRSYLLGFLLVGCLISWSTWFSLSQSGHIEWISLTELLEWHLGSTAYWSYPLGFLLDEFVYLLLYCFICLFDLLSVLLDWDCFISLSYHCLWFTVWLIEGFIICFGNLLLFRYLYLLCCRRFKCYIYMHKSNLLKHSEIMNQ